MGAAQIFEMFIQFKHLHSLSTDYPRIQAEDSERPIIKEDT